MKFVVYGAPIPQGSKRVFTPRGCRKPVVTEDNKKTLPWRQQIAGTAIVEKAACRFITIPRPLGVHVELAFFFDKPKSVKTNEKSTKPDVDKLLRAVLDALTGVLFDDDSQVVSVNMTKRFGSPARVEVMVDKYADTVA